MREHAPVRVNADELEEACFFVSMAEVMDAAAFVHRRTGQVRFFGPDIDLEDVTEEELLDSTVYAEIPDETELELGTNVVRDFTASKVPDLSERVDAIFRRPGAYGQFKDMLSQEGKLELWFDYEAERLESALREWCEREGFEMVKADSVGGE